jgi:diacylglycerol kinase (ATP)
MQTRQSNAVRATRETSRDAGDDPFAEMHDIDGTHGDGAPHTRYAERSRPAAARKPIAMSHTTRATTQAEEDALIAAQADEEASAEAFDTESRAEAHEPLSPDDPLAPLPFNPYKGNRGVTRAWHAMKNSFAGFRVAIREESAFRQELTLACILVPCGVIVPVDAVSRVLLLGSVLLVLIVELLNSSVEAAIDRISLERHELSRRAKDLGSAAVMVALVMCVLTWGLIVGPLVVGWVKGWF